MTEPTVKQIDLSQPDVLVVIPTIPGRDDLLKRAVASIREDMGHVVVAGAIEVDLGGLGPASTRNRAVVQTINAGVRQIGRANVWSPVPNAHRVCRPLLERKK